MLAVNLQGLLHLANAFKKHLVASKGAMVNIASMYSTFGSPRVPAYGASKAGVAQLTKSLALPWAEQGQVAGGVLLGPEGGARTAPVASSIAARSVHGGSKGPNQAKGLPSS